MSDDPEELKNDEKSDSNDSNEEKSLREEKLTSKSENSKFNDTRRKNSETMIFLNSSISPSSNDCDILEIRETSKNRLITLLKNLKNFSRHDSTKICEKIDDKSFDTKELEKASTSTSIKRSILRENIETRDKYFYNNTFYRIYYKFWWNNNNRDDATRNEKKKTIIFVDETESRDSNESIVTIIGTTRRPLRSALRGGTGSGGGGGSLRSGNSSSVRFSLPQETTIVNDNDRMRMIKIGNLNIYCDINDDEDNDDDDNKNCIKIFKSLNRTRFFKIIVSFALGIIVPSFLIIPVLVYLDNSNN